MEQKQNKTFNEIINGEEFSLKDLFSILKYSAFALKKVIFSLFIIAIIFSLFLYYSQSNEFESEATVLIDQSGGNQSLGNNSLSSLLGINTVSIGNEGNLFGPDMYEDIIKSDAFLSDLVESKILFDKKNNKIISLVEYFKLNPPKRKYFNFEKNAESATKNFVLVDSLIHSSNISDSSLYFLNKIPPIVELSSETSNTMSIIKDRIKLTIKGKKLNIHVTMPNQNLSANLCKVVLDKIINYVTKYKTTKQRENMIFLENRYLEAKQKYINAQNNLANYKDMNNGLIFQSAQTREQLLTNELNLSFNIYNQFALQLEQTKFELKKEMPFFIVTDPIKLPGNNKEKMFVIILKSIFISLFLSFILVIFKTVNPTINHARN